MRKNYKHDTFKSDRHVKNSKAQLMKISTGKLKLERLSRASTLERNKRWKYA